ncbi:hypothetical protein [Streptomyces sp. NPDC059063]|uniref:hypothetical protein n=1 Tax=unclassified Streptomyces TaxID=2593676 RepID=UPI0036B71B86
MIKDPSAAGPPCPYDALAPAGVTPWTTHTAMQDVPFELLARRLMTPVTQAAWDELRTVRGRMLADLFRYDVDLAAELPGAVAEVDALLDAAAGADGMDGADDTDGGEPLSAEDVARLVDTLVRFDGCPAGPADLSRT